MQEDDEVTVSAATPDWSREKPRRFWDPGRRLLGTIRGYERADRKSPIIRWVARKYWAIGHRFWSVISGAEIHLRTEIGGGLLIPHPNGVVVHPGVKIGCNCLIFQQVTLGTNGTGEVPKIGGHVDIGAGAKVLGGVQIGDHAVIGANAVVLSDVPAHAMAVGVPATVRKLADD